MHACKLKKNDICVFKFFGCLSLSVFTGKYLLKCGSMVYCGC
jgi:hypothetical protein